MRKIAIKLHDKPDELVQRTALNDRRYMNGGKDVEAEGLLSRCGFVHWLLPPPRQLPFRWKCDGCPLFCMIKYRGKNATRGLPRNAPEEGKGEWMHASPRLHAGPNPPPRLLCFSTRSKTRATVEICILKIRPPQNSLRLKPI